MRVLTRLLRKTIVLGLAGLGAYKAWEIASAYMQPAKEKAQGVKDASRDAADSMVETSRLAVAEVAESVADAALGGSTPAAPSSAQTA